MSTHSTIPSECSSLETLDSIVQPEAIRLAHKNGNLIVNIHNDTMPKVITYTEKSTIEDINKTYTNWDGYGRGGETISKMANIAYFTSTKYFNTTPSTTATTPIWVKHYKNGSQNNLCNGMPPGSGICHNLDRKVYNHSPNAQKKNLVTLTHLPKRPPVDITFSDISYSVSEGRKRGFKTILKGVNGSARLAISHLVRKTTPFRFLYRKYKVISHVRDEKKAIW